jgi:hypothetical protein
MLLTLSLLSLQRWQALDGLPRKTIGQRIWMYAARRNDARDRKARQSDEKEANHVCGDGRMGEDGHKGVKTRLR